MDQISDESEENTSAQSNTSFDRLLNSINMLEYTRRVNVVSTLTFTLIGLIGHFLTVLVFSQKRFRKNSSNVYLLCLAINNAFYLVIHVFEDTIRTLIYLDEENTRHILFLNLIDQNEVSCRLIHYSRFVLRLVSSMIICAFSLQRLHLVCSPFSKKFKSTKSAWLTVALIVLVSCLGNVWVLVIYKNSPQENSIYSCDIQKELSQAYFHITLAYICITMLFPISIVFVCNSFIIQQLFDSKKNFKNKSTATSKAIKLTNKSQPRDPFRKKNPKHKPYFVSMNQMVLRTTSKANSSTYIAKTLVLITFSFAFLNLPYFVTWSVFYMEIVLLKSNDLIKQNYLYSAVELSKIFYVLNYSIYFYIFIVSGSVFRNQLKYSVHSSRLNKNRNYFKVEYYTENV